ncbi:MAG: tetratricopeptide repeat protein [candidate division WOR-3 bacterium]|nr:MAG: tetratricopeptide repeat protein [candidate division WOR-3 bacterium]
MINRSVLMICLCFLVLVSSGVAEEDSLNVFDEANKLLENRRYDDALKAYEYFLHENPDHHLAPAAKWAIANIYYTIKQDYHKAAIVYQNILSKHSDSGWEIFSFDRLGLCYEKQEKWEDAVRIYESALERLNEPFHSELAADWTPVFTSRLLASYRKLGDQASIVRFYVSSLERDPDGLWAPQYQFEMARIRLEMNEPVEAANDFAKVVDRYPLSAYAEQVRAEHADLLVSQLGYDWKPYSIFKNSVELSQSGRFEEAQEGFDLVIEKKQKTGLEHAARFQKELTAFRRTGDAVALREMIKTSRGAYPYGLGGIDDERFIDLLDVIIETESVITSDPRNADAHRRMASAYYEMQAYYPAIERYKQAIELDPENSRQYNMLGYCQIGVEAYDDAIRAFRRLVEKSPDDPNSYDSMAEAYFRKGDIKQAIRHYEKAISLDEEFAHPYYMLGEIYHGMNKSDLARDYLQRYLELAPNGFRAEPAQAILDQMGEID